MESGGAIYQNTVAVGLLSSLFGVEPKVAKDYVGKHFRKKPQDVIANNVAALERGYAEGERLMSSGKARISLKRNGEIASEPLVSGAEAMALGAIAGGCNFISAYPMTPSTGVFTFLSQHSKEFGIVAEQAEDEISAMNMSLGAWYAGARALVSTAGGGFALMVEGLSLAGMIESPIVINLAQRPAPATGLPTRTEQGDLELALYAGHGEFPRIILAPGTVEEAFNLTQKAFNLADKYQMPVFILTDQYLADSYYNLPSLDLKGLNVEKSIIKTDEGYRRYALTPDGISPRGIPGHGSGLVVVDSDEHDEEGHITEDLKVRSRMVDKRLRKLEAAKADAIAPTLIGGKYYKTLVVCWGSNRGPVAEALSRLKRTDVSAAHFSQVYPLHKDTASMLARAKRLVIVENNATSQFGRLLRLHTGFDITKRILKYDGMPFSVEELEKRIGEEIK